MYLENQEILESFGLRQWDYVKQRGKPETCAHGCGLDSAFLAFLVLQLRAKARALQWPKSPQICLISNMHHVCLLVYLFVCLFACLFVCLCFFLIGLFVWTLRAKARAVQWTNSPPNLSDLKCAPSLFACLFDWFVCLFGH